MTDTTVLWVHAHPEPESVNGHLARHGMTHLRDGGAAVLESDLYGMGWQPVLDRAGLALEGEPFCPTAHTRAAFVAGTLPDDVLREQNKIRAADAIVVQFPLWWYGMPAMLKGWFDRVFVAGFAFGTDPATGRRLRFENGPFVGKRALVVATMGDRPASIGPRGKSGHFPELMFGLLHGTFAYTGMSALPPFAVPSADRLDQAGVAAAMADLTRRLDALFTDDPIPYRPQFQGDYTDDWELAEHVRPGDAGLSVHLRTE